nr:MAG TPA: hypothetical protein [Caudoviricetes sp.]DAR27673.1 MAG TPA: hypothetical protein [Caudoviricetes sp.]
MRTRSRCSVRSQKTRRPQLVRTWQVSSIRPVLPTCSPWRR